MVSLRKARREDFSTIILLIREFAAFQNSSEKVNTSTQQLIGDEKLFQCLVAVNPEQQIIGFASYFFAYFSWSGKALWLDDLYIQAPYRNLGIGKRLFSAVKDIAIGENVIPFAGRFPNGIHKPLPSMLSQAQQLRKQSLPVTWSLASSQNSSMLRRD